MSRLASLKLSALLAVLVLALGAGACAGAGKTGPGAAGGGKKLVSSDGAFELRVPQAWKKASNLNAVAVLQAENRAKEAYALLIVDPKAPFSGTALGAFADTQIQKFQQALTSAQVTGPNLVIINKDEALQYEIKGAADGVDVVYLYTFIETPDNFLKVVTWSLADKYQDNKPALAAVTASVRQIKVGPTTAPGAASAGPTTAPGASTSPGPGTASP